MILVKRLIDRAGFLDVDIVGIGLEINVLTSKFIFLGYQMLGEIGCHPEISFYVKLYHSIVISSNSSNQNFEEKVIILSAVCLTWLKFNKSQNHTLISFGGGFQSV